MMHVLVKERLAGSTSYNYLKSVACVLLFLLLLDFHVRPAAAFPTDGTVVDVDEIPTTARSKVLIVGAGMAGIKAAHTLQASGLDDFIVLEATDRIGGRVRSHKLESGHTLNLGPQTIQLRVNTGAKWVHGEEGKKGENPVWTLAKKCRLSSSPSNFEDRVFYDDSEQRFLDESETAQSVEDFKRARNQISDKVDIYPDDKTLREALDDEKWTSDTPLQKAIEWYEIDYELAESPERTAAKHQEPLTLDDFGDAEQIVTDSRGFNHVIECLAKDVFSYDASTASWADNRLKLDTKVVEIRYSGSSIEVIVSTPRSARYICDYVVVTVSLGVLKSDTIEFTPRLPERKRNAIKNFDMGLLTTIFVKFKTKFWAHENENFIYASDKRGYYPAYVNLAVHYPNDANWYVLIVSVTGDLARSVEKQSDTATKNDIMNILRKMYQTRSTIVPDPIEIVVPKWGRDPLFKGAYSNWSPGFTDQDFGHLNSSVDGRIFFAGEAMSYSYYGFLHGSFLSGEQIALCINSNINGESTDSSNDKICPDNLNKESADDSSDDNVAVIAAPATVGGSALLVVSFWLLFWLRQKLKHDID